MTDTRRWSLTAMMPAALAVVTLTLACTACVGDASNTPPAPGNDAAAVDDAEAGPPADGGNAAVWDQSDWDKTMWK